MFKITMGKGFHMTFDNGLTISVQFGFGNYCENRNKFDLINSKVDIQCEDCEIAVWDKHGDFITNLFIDCHGDDVRGYLSTDQVADIIHKVKNY